MLVCDVDQDALNLFDHLLIGKPVLSPGQVGSGALEDHWDHMEIHGDNRVSPSNFAHMIDNQKQFVLTPNGRWDL
jgi:hypothetical protein